MRKLASVRSIGDILPIEGADAIECAVVDGWTCVVKKGEFKKGDLGIFFEIDSFLPAQDERYAFLEPRFIEWNGKRGARIKTMKLRGQLSQGLMLPLSSFPEVKTYLQNLQTVYDEHEGQPSVLDDMPIDVTDVLGIEKWERPESGNINAMAKGNFPVFIPKTDQERIQNMKWILEKRDEQGIPLQFQATMKLDGSSCTVYYVDVGSIYYNLASEKFENDEDFTYGSDDVVGVCSRNIDLKDGDNHFWNSVRDVIEVFKHIDHLAIAIQGEVVGPGIQGNYEKMDENKFFVYDIFDIEKQEYWNPVITELFCRAHGLNHVPILIKSITLDDVTMEDILEFADGPGMNKGVKREGVVFKSSDNKYSFKAISNSYLLKTGN